MKQTKQWKLVAAAGVVACASALTGCGSDPAPGPSGSVIQGPVSGAVVFADKKLSGSAFGNFTLDADEAATKATTNAQGGFTLPVAPGYDYVIVSQGGTDTITGVEAMQLLAPAGAKNVTPLTTIVALEPTVKDKIESLGVKFDDNIATSATPAALLLVKSIETVVASLTTTLDPQGTKLSAAQVNDIQAKTVAAIATEIKKTTTTITTLTDAAALKTTMTTALTSAITDIDATSSNITVTNAAAVASSCANAVTTVANAINAGGTFATTGSASEATIFTTTVVNNIVSQIETAATSNASSLTVTTTPTTPSTTGSTGGTGGSGVGSNF